MEGAGEGVLQPLPLQNRRDRRPGHPQPLGDLPGRLPLAAERFIGTLLWGWAYRRPFRTSNQRTRALPKWLRDYNEKRPHRSLGMIPPMAKIKRAL